MGVAFIVMCPVLYTDTTDSWRLADRKKRIKVGLAGMAVELATAKYIGELVDGEEPKTLELSVKSLAGPQVNTGDYLSSSKKVPLVV